MGSTKGLELRFQQSISSGDYYVAEQACRTLYHRLIHPRAPQERDLQGAFKQVIGGALTLLQRGRPKEGTSLGLLAVKHLVDYRVAVEKGVLGQLREVVNAYGKEEDDLREKARLLKAIVAWTAEEVEGGCENGDAGFNGELGVVMAQLEDYKTAQKAFVRSDNPLQFAEMLDRWVREKGMAGERDLFLARAVLLYLASGNVRDANALFSKFVRLSGWESVAPPLSNFCELLLLIVQYDRQAARLYQKLVKTYAVSLDRDPGLKQYTDQIGEHFFGIQPPKPGGIMGMMSEMLSAGFDRRQ